MFVRLQFLQKRASLNYTYVFRFVKSPARLEGARAWIHQITLGQTFRPIRCLKNDKNQRNMLTIKVVYI